VLVTGVRGKVGSAAAARLRHLGADVLGTDLGPPVYERDDVRYVRADLTDAGACFTLVDGCDVVVHAAALPDPLHEPPHVVFSNNLMSTFHLLEAASRLGVRRFVLVSSETAPGFFFPCRPQLPRYVPVDEEHPLEPQDPYALAKVFGEQLCDATVRRGGPSCVSVRPSWVQWEGNYARNLGPLVRDAAEPSESLGSYTDVYDLADALAMACTADVEGHEVVYVANPDNAGGHDLVEKARRAYGDAVEVRPVSRPDASGISSAKAERVLGWTARRSWRDYLDADGGLTVEVPASPAESPQVRR
ncbi:MAG: NAD-dependent epimerase/dehydratase family protein, partial [Actinomycetes bacterium]